MPPDCPAQPFWRHHKRLHHRSHTGTMVQKYNCISLKFNDLRFAYFGETVNERNDLRFAYFGETVNERNEMDIELISFIAMLKISFGKTLPQH